MKKKEFTTIVLALFSIGLFACSCPKIKGLNGKFAGFQTMSKLMNHTLLVEVSKKTEMGIFVKIRKDYKKSTELNELFIENGNSGINCNHSTENFKIGEKYLIVLWSENELEKNKSLSICYESFINVSHNQTKAQIVDKEEFQLRKWNIEQIEKKLGIEI